MGSRNSYRGSQNSLVSLLINAVIVLLLLASILFTALGAYVSFVSTSGNGVPELFGLGLVSIQTDSMSPELNTGDLVINKKVNDPSELNNGDIITYWTVIGSGERVLNTHRIVNVYDGGGYLIFETQGDNNNSVDAMTVHGSEIVGTYKMRIPMCGKLFDYMQTSTGFAVSAAVIVILTVVLLLRRRGHR